LDHDPSFDASCFRASKQQSIAFNEIYRVGKKDRYS